MSLFDPGLVPVLKGALEEAMTRVPPEHSTPSVKAYLAECILKAAAQGRATHDELVAIATEQVPSAVAELA